MEKYLIEEVLMDLPPEVFRPLLCSSILSRFCAPLLVAVCSAGSGSVPAGFSVSEFIDLLRRESHFTISLDLPGEWFRYHHLFREILTAELNRKYEPRDIASLHERACTWFETEGLIEEAIRHALAAGNPNRAAEIISRHRISTLERYGYFVVERWLDMLPREIREERIDLLAAKLYTLTSQYRLQEVSWILQKVDSLPADGAVDEALVAEIDSYRGLIQLLLNGDGNAANRHFNSAYASRALRSELLKSRLDFFLALSRLMIGEREQAIRFLEKQIRSLHDPGIPTIARATAFLAIIRLQSGDLSGASHDAGRVIERLTECAPIIMAWALYVRANAQFQNFHLRDAAMDFAAVTLKWRLANLRVAVEAFGALAIADHFLLRRDEAGSQLEKLFKAAREIGGTHSLNLAESFSARLALLQGDLKSALCWADAYDGELVPSDTLMFLEVPLVTQCRVWVERGSTRTLARALPQLQSLLERFEGLHLTAHMVDVLALQAVAFSKKGQIGEARAALKKALSLAFQRGFVRPFIESGPTMAALLDQFEGDPSYADFIWTLRTAFESATDSSVAKPPPTRPIAQMPASVQPLAEALTNRELDVLELLAQRLQNKEIANRLSISSNTVKDHLKNIYGKLGVRGRREAVKRATSFGLLSTHP
jgi:LuxR family maltose regulon positive regulatory protein